MQPPKANAVVAFKMSVIKSPVDWQHVSILCAYVAGVGYVAKTLILSLITGHAAPSGSLVTSFATLAVTAVLAFLKNKPGTLIQAVDEGENVGGGQS